jgi:hypothetical protein
MEGKERKHRKIPLIGFAGLAVFLAVDFFDAYVHRPDGGVPRKQGVYYDLGDDIRFLKKEIAP